MADFLKAQPGVAAIHDLHMWSMITTETALTVHLITPAGYPGDAFTADLAHELKSRFSIDHSTIQIETDASAGCELESDHVV